MKDKLKILVACHKPVDVYSSDVYTPIHVGRAVSKCTDQMRNMIGDDTGDNISCKNPNYCELTAQYWGWKNLECEYIGLCLYSRYFRTIYTIDNIQKEIGRADVILVSPIYEKWSMGIRLRVATSIDDYYIFFKCLEKLYPEYVATAEKFLSGNRCIPSNMFIMKKDVFDKFAEWQFNILFEMEKYVRLSPYSRAARVFGYFGEMMLPIYCIHNKFNIKFEDYSLWPGGESYGKTSKVRDLIVRGLYRAMGQPMGYDYKAVQTGLRIDGIDLEK